MRRLALVTALPLFLAVAPLRAQAGLEITPTVGYRFGGTVEADEGLFCGEQRRGLGRHHRLSGQAGRPRRIGL